MRPSYIKQKKGTIMSVTKIALITLVTALMVVPMAACAEAPPVTEYSLKLTGALTETITEAEFEEGADSTCHGVECSIEDEEGTINTYSGIPLWMLCGWVDDEVKHGGGAYNDELANNDYDIIVIADDGYSVTFGSQTIARNNNIILANEVDGQPIGKGGPLRLAGPELSTGQRVKNVVEIHLELPE
jgi:hypothetical protein